jgi:Zn-dependent hydrolases, including glyoxylases
MIDIKLYYFNELRECCYVLWDETKECVIIDPGCKVGNESDRLVKFIEEKELKPVKILLTHGHFDHVMGMEYISKKWGLRVYVHPDDKPLIEKASLYGSMFGFDIAPFTGEYVDLRDGDTITFGKSSLRVIHTPGHSKGGCCFFDEEEATLFSGDTLFAGSIGRTDNEGGDYDTLIESIMTKLAKLPAGTEVLPGHGLSTTISYELSTNPFLEKY